MTIKTDGVDPTRIDRMLDKDGGAAFASTAVNNLGNVYHQQGMTLRDYFAGQAVAGLAGRMMAPSGIIDRGKRVDMDSHHRDLARAAVSMADALIEELKK